MTKLLLATFLLTTTSVFAAADEQPLETVANVDLQRYVGKWHEIARLPQRFEKGCVEVTAEYSLRDDGKIAVVNTCRKDDGKTKQAKGKAKVVDKTTNAKLKVSFFWPFYGDYWILELGADYEYAVVGAPDREYFWILSRSKAMSKPVIDGILERFKKKGFEFSELIINPTP